MQGGELTFRARLYHSLGVVAVRLGLKATKKPSYFSPMLGAFLAGFDMQRRFVNADPEARDQHDLVALVRAVQELEAAAEEARAQQRQSRRQQRRRQEEHPDRE